MGSQLRFLFMTLVSLMILGCSEPETAVQTTPEVSVIVTEPHDVPIFSETYRNSFPGGRFP